MMYECAKSQSNIPKNSLKHGTKVEIPCTLAPRGGGTQAFFDRDARPRINFNYPRMTKFKPQKSRMPKIQTQKIE